MEVLFKQYDLIRERRAVLFEYCESLTSPHFVQDLESFGGRSIRYLMVHTVNTYFFWIGHFAGLNNRDFFKSEAVQNIQAARGLYHDNDILVNSFLQRYKPDFDEPIVNKVPRRDFELSLSPLELFTHVITHEYHHKGQILSMSRQLGYIPVDTDLIRF
jgi:uncharacterized damage-inducible protein DinB